MKRTLWQPLTVGLAAMLLALPVYAENTQAPDAAAAPVAQSAPAQKEENRLAPYLGKKITKQIIEGNVAIPKEEIAAALKTKQGMEFTEEGLSQDLSAIYDMGWFYDMHPEFKLVPEGVQVIYHVLENPVYKDVKVNGNTVIDGKKVESCFDLEKDKIANLKQINKCVQKLEEEYRSNGYILARVTDVHMEQDGTLQVTVNEGLVEGFKVKGNKKCKDYVITREMKLKPGKPFNAKDARRSMQRVYNLGYFEDVNVKLNPGREPNSVEVEIDVVEMNTGTFGIGAGYSNDDGFVGMISIGDKNFRGTGDAISITYETSGDDEDAHGYTFSYRHPWIDKKETVGTFRVYNRTYEYDDYDTDGDLKETYMRKYSGGEFQFGRPVSEYSTNYLTFRNRKDEYVRNVDWGNQGDRSNDWDWRNKNFGTTRSITYEHVTDTRDNIYNPTTGTRISLGAEFAGWLGGDFNFQKYTISDNRYFKVGHAQVVALRGQYGFGNGDISEFNQYEIGGQNTLRGYREDQFRGDKMILGTVEYRFPIVSKVQGALFTDWGGAWNGGATPENIKGSIGVGLSLNTPLGPLRIDYGRGSDGGRVHFTVGTGF